MSEAADAIAQVLLHYTPAERIKLLMQAILTLESDIDQRGHVTNPTIKLTPKELEAHYKRLELEEKRQGKKRHVRRVQNAKPRNHQRDAKRGAKARR